MKFERESSGREREPSHHLSIVTRHSSVFAPVATPQDIVQRLNGALNKALGSPAVVERMASQRADVRPGTSDDLGRFVREDLAKWKKVVAQAGIKLE